MLDQALCSGPGPQTAEGPIFSCTSLHGPTPTTSCWQQGPDLGLRSIPGAPPLLCSCSQDTSPVQQGRHRAPQPPPQPCPPRQSPWCTHRMPRQLLLLPLPLQSRPLLVLQALRRGGRNALRQRGRGRCVSHCEGTQPPLTSQWSQTLLHDPLHPGKASPWLVGRTPKPQSPEPSEEHPQHYQKSTPAETTSKGGAENPHCSRVYFTSSLP